MPCDMARKVIGHYARMDMSSWSIYTHYWELWGLAWGSLYLLAWKGIQLGPLTAPCKGIIRRTDNA